MNKCIKCNMVFNQEYYKWFDNVCGYCIAEELKIEAWDRNIILGCDCGCEGDDMLETINYLEKGGE